MALKPCKECKKEVASSAKTCPHCGVTHPATGAGEVIGGLIVLGLIIFALVKCTGGEELSAEEKAAAAAAEKLRQANCHKDLDCWTSKHMTAATVACAPAIEKLAKYDFRWTEGALGSKFRKVAWLDQAAGTFSVLGDKIELQNGFGNFVVHSYVCDFNPKTKQVLHAEAEAGRLQ